MLGPWTIGPFGFVKTTKAVYGTIDLSLTSVNLII